MSHKYIIDMMAYQNQSILVKLPESHDGYWHITTEVQGQ